MIPKKQYLVFVHILLEFLILNLSLFLTNWLKNGDDLKLFTDSAHLMDYLWLTVLFNLAWGLIIIFNQDQDFYINYSFRKRIKYFVKNTFLLVGIVASLVVVLKVEYFNRTTIFLPIFLFAVTDLLLFFILLEFFRRFKKYTLRSNILIIGRGEKWKQLIDFRETIQKLGYKIIGFLDDEVVKPSIHGIQMLGAVNDLPTVLDKNLIDEIFITPSSLNKRQMSSVLKMADYRGVRVNLIPEPLFAREANFKSYLIDDLPVFQYRQTPLDDFRSFVSKKAFDVFFSLTVLITLSPLYLIIAFLIYLDGKGPVLYTPLRKGEGGGSFKCYKFRTMSVCDDPINGQKSTVRNDPRITRIGQFLRKYDLDELPQFFNVFKGDMSIVGPRPHRVRLQDDFRKIVNDYMVRHYVKPGITGWAQVHGWRGPTKTDRQKKERIKYDLWYIENWNFWMDMKIIFLTVFGKKTRTNAF